MQNIALYVSSILITFLLAWRLIAIVPQLWGRIKKQIIVARIRKGSLFLVGLLSIVIFSLLAIVSTREYFYQQEEDLVRMPSAVYDDVFLANGKVKEVSFDHWNVNHHFDRLVKGDWRSGKTYVYNESSQMIQAIAHKDSTDIDLNNRKFHQRRREEMEYNEQGVKAKVRYFDAGVKCDSVIARKFDENGYPKYEVSYNGETGEKLGSKSFFLDKGTMIARSFDTLGMANKEVEYKYWKLNLLRQVVFYSLENGHRQKLTEVNYDKRGLIQSLKDYSPGLDLPNKSWIYERDDNGEILNCMISNQSSEIAENHKAEYLKYDEKGNWTEMIWYKDGYPYGYRTRKITYYSEP